MIHAAPVETERAGRRIAREMLSLLAGAGFTLGLLLFLAHFETHAPVTPGPDMADLRAIALPAEPPPPVPLVHEASAVPAAAPLAGIEIGASESPVKIAVVPPDLDALLATTETAPAASIPTVAVDARLRPRLDEFSGFDRVFQQSEVDRIPTVLHRPDPVVPPRVRNNASILRVTVLLVVDTIGAVSNVRVLKTSGNPEFDAIIVQSIQDDWAFTPAMKKGRKVKCLLQQTVAVRWTAGSPFTL